MIKYRKASDCICCGNPIFNQAFRRQKYCKKCRRYIHDQRSGLIWQLAMTKRKVKDTTKRMGIIDLKHRKFIVRNKKNIPKEVGIIGQKYGRLITKNKEYVICCGCKKSVKLETLTFVIMGFRKKFVCNNIKCIMKVMVGGLR